MIKISERSFTRPCLNTLSDSIRAKLFITFYKHILRFTFYRLARYILSCQIFILFSLENDDMESSKRSVKLLSLIFIIRCLTKSNLIRQFLSHFGQISDTVMKMST